MLQLCQKLARRLHRTVGRRTYTGISWQDRHRCSAHAGARRLWISQPQCGLRPAMQCTAIRTGVLPTGHRCAPSAPARNGRWPTRSRGGSYEAGERKARHDLEDPVAERPAARRHRHLLACCQQPLGRPDLPLRQPAAAPAARALRYQAHAARPLGHDAGAELHLRAPEPGHPEVRPRHGLRLRSGARRARRRGQHLPRRRLQRGLSAHRPGRRRAAETVPAVLIPRRQARSPHRST